MGLLDTFSPEDRVQLKFSDFYELVQQAGQCETVMNGVNCNVPHRYIREMISGVSEEPAPDPAAYLILNGYDNREYDPAAITAAKEPHHTTEDPKTCYKCARYNNGIARITDFKYCANCVDYSNFKECTTEAGKEI